MVSVNFKLPFFNIPKVPEDTSPVKIGEFLATVKDNFDSFRKGDAISLDLFQKINGRKTNVDVFDRTNKVGILEFSEYKSIFFIDNLANEYKAKIKGIGTAFLQFMAEKSLINNKQLELCAFNAHNPPAMFYLKAGFIPTERTDYEQIVNQGVTTINNVDMISTDNIFLVFKDRILNNPFFQESVEKLKAKIKE